tara:strand:+ start:1767 stop:3539 length:1773 start_codon:yes stop_codon:yes gene_type:complete
MDELSTRFYNSITEGDLDDIKNLSLNDLSKNHKFFFEIDDKIIYPITLSVRKGSYEITKFLLDKGFSLIVFDNSLRTPIHYAVLTNNYRLCKLLIDYGANIHSKDRIEVNDANTDTDTDTDTGTDIENSYYELTPLDYCTVETDESIIELLIDNHAFINDELFDNYFGNKVWTKPNLLEKIKKHISAIDSVFHGDLLFEKPSLIDGINFDLINSLTFFENKYEELKDDLFLKRDIDGNTILHYLCGENRSTFNNNVELYNLDFANSKNVIFNYLQSTKFIEYLTNVRNSFDETPIHTLAVHGEYKMLHELGRKSCYFGIKNRDTDLYPIQVALLSKERYRYFVIKTLLEYGEGIRITSNDLAELQANDNDYVIELLIKDDKELRNDLLNFESQIHMSNNITKVNTILKELQNYIDKNRNIQVMNMRFQDGNTLIHRAVLSENKSFIRFLVMKDENFENIKKRKNDNLQTVFDLPISQNISQDIINYLKEQMQIKREKTSKYRYLEDKKRPSSPSVDAVLSSPHLLGFIGSNVPPKTPPRSGGFLKIKKLKKQKSKFNINSQKTSRTKKSQNTKKSKNTELRKTKKKKSKN